MTRWDKFVVAAFSVAAVLYLVQSVWSYGAAFAFAALMLLLIGIEEQL